MENMIGQIKHNAYLAAVIYAKSLRDSQNSTYRLYCMGRLDEVEQLAGILGVDVSDDVRRGKDIG